MENMSEAIIRTLRKDDYPALIDLVRRTWYAEYDERTGLRPIGRTVWHV